MKTASKRNANARLTSNSTTLIYETRRPRTKSGHCSEKKIEYSLQARANLFASDLLKLLTPIQPGENINFLPNYQPQLYSASLKLSELDLDKSAAPYHQHDPTAIRHQFSQRKTQNLGALICLNLFMASAFHDTSWGVVLSPVTGNPFFTQKLSSFWSNFFNQTTPIHLFSHPLDRSIALSIAHLSSKNASWWKETDINTDQHDLHQTLLNECFEVALRLYLTPESFIEFIADSIVGTDLNAKRFKQHVMDQITHFKTNFLSILSSSQKAAWHALIQDKGLGYYKKFAEEISGFYMYKSGSISRSLLKYTTESMLQRAMLMGIPSLDDPLILTDIECCFRQDVLIVAATYILDRVDHHWPQLNENRDYFLWSIFDELTSKLEKTKGYCIGNTNHLHIYMLLKSIAFQKNNVARLFIQGIPHLKTPGVINQPFPAELCYLEEHKALVGHSLLHIALQYKNNNIAHFLFSKGATLLSHEQEMVPALNAARTALLRGNRRHSFYAERGSEFARSRQRSYAISCDSIRDFLNESDGQSNLKPYAGFI
ncbi:MAG TPA: hypothetical protein DDY37_00955 [Legionella sp.]|nr:hypothetical protein [Legionella sp.]